MIYFVRDLAGRVKIGLTECIESRLRSLQTAAYGDLELIRSIPGGRKTERWMHARFDALRIQGEWFRFCPEMLTIVAPEELPDSYEDDPTQTIAVRFSLALKRATRFERSPMKAISAVSGRSPKIADLWLNSKCLPNAESLAKLCASYDEVWKLICKLSGRDRASGAAECELLKIDSEIEAWKQRWGVHRVPLRSMQQEDVGNRTFERGPTR